MKGTIKEFKRKGTIPVETIAVSENKILKSDFDNGNKSVVMSNTAEDNVFCTTKN